MTPDELHPILTAYRTRIQPAWSKATAHPSFEGADGSPVGQCGVTSAWLQRRLREDHGISAMYCLGSVQTAGGFHRDHCWLDIPDLWAPLATNSRVVIDLAGGQYGLMPVICGFIGELARLNFIHYIAERRLTEEQVRDPLTSRLALLEGALS